MSQFFVVVCCCRKLVDPQITCFEPECCGNLMHGVEFHKFYFANGMKRRCSCPLINHCYLGFIYHHSPMTKHPSMDLSNCERRTCSSSLHSDCRSSRVYILRTLKL